MLSLARQKQGEQGRQQQREPITLQPAPECEAAVWPRQPEAPAHLCMFDQVDVDVT